MNLYYFEAFRLKIKKNWIKKIYKLIKNELFKNSNQVYQKAKPNIYKTNKRFILLNISQNE